MNWYAIGSLAALLVCYAAAEEEPVAVPSALWFGKQPQSPVLPPNTFGLDFSIRPARTGRGETVALFATAHLPGRDAAIYGGRINGAIEIVAIDSATGKVYSRTGERPGAVPLSLVMDRPLHEPGDAPVSSIDTWLNCDLQDHLGLPQRPASYTVFLWLDDLTSPVKMVAVRGPAPNPLTSGGILLQMAGGRGPNLQGVLDAPLLHRDFPLNVLALDYRTRAIASHVLGVTSALKPAFTVDSVALLGAANGKNDMLFIAAVAGTSISNVVRVPRLGLRQ